MEFSHPAWLLERWERQYGAETAAAIARANLRVPETYVNRKRARIQDIGSQSIVPLLGLQPGQTFLDLCAAPATRPHKRWLPGERLSPATFTCTGWRRSRRWESGLVVLDGTRRCLSAAVSTAS